MVVEDLNQEEKRLLKKLLFDTINPLNEIVIMNIFHKLKLGD